MSDYDNADKRIKDAVSAHEAGVLDSESQTPTCANTNNGQRCISYPGHDAAGDDSHWDADGNTWPTHRPWNPETGYSSV